MVRLKMTFAVFLLLFLLQAPLPSRADIYIHDDVAVKGQTVMLEADTKGRFFARGGEVVEFTVDGATVGQTLSGGDGIAFKEYVPIRTGLLPISARSGEEEHDGYLLVVEKKGRILVIDVENSLFESVITKKLREGSLEAVKKLEKAYSIVYLNKLPAVATLMKKWIEEAGFPPAPLIHWHSGALFTRLARKRVRVGIIIGSPDVVKSARRFRPKAFSFQKAKGATKVGDWNEIVEKLLGDSSGRKSK